MTERFGHLDLRRRTRYVNANDRTVQSISTVEAICESVECRRSSSRKPDGIAPALPCRPAASLAVSGRRTRRLDRRHDRRDPAAARRSDADRPAAGPPGGARAAAATRATAGSSRALPRLDRRRLREGRHVDHRGQGRRLCDGRADRRERRMSSRATCWPRIDDGDYAIAVEPPRRASTRRTPPSRASAGRSRPGRHGRPGQGAAAVGQGRSDRARRPNIDRAATLMQSSYGTQQRLDQARADRDRSRRGRGQRRCGRDRRPKPPSTCSRRRSARRRRSAAELHTAAGPGRARPSLHGDPCAVRRRGRQQGGRRPGNTCSPARGCSPWCRSTAPTSRRTSRRPRSSA